MVADRSLLFMISKEFKTKTLCPRSFILKGHDGFLPDSQKLAMCSEVQELVISGSPSHPPSTPCSCRKYFYNHPYTKFIELFVSVLSRMELQWWVLSLLHRISLKLKMQYLLPCLALLYFQTNIYNIKNNALTFVTALYLLWTLAISHMCLSVTSDGPLSTFSTWPH